jgi:hypothetical protein
MLVSVGLPDISLIPPATVLSRSPPHGIPMRMMPPSEGTMLSPYNAIEQVSLVQDLDMCPWQNTSSDFLEMMFSLYINGVLNLAAIYLIVFFTGVYVYQNKK